MAVIDRTDRWQSPSRHTGQLSHDEAQEALARIERLAHLLDSLVTIPGTGFRIGIDALIGLVPVIGDIVSQAISTYIFWAARRLALDPRPHGRQLTRRSGPRRAAGAG